MEHDIDEVSFFLKSSFDDSNIYDNELYDGYSNWNLWHKTYIKEIRITKDEKVIVIKKGSVDRFNLLSSGFSNDVGTPGWVINDNEDEIIFVQAFEGENGTIIMVELVMQLRAVFNNFLEICDLSNSHYPWAVNKTGKIIFNSLIPAESAPNLDEETAKALTGDEPSAIHFINAENRKIKVLSVFYPLFSSDNEIYIVFSYPIDNLSRSILTNAFVFAIISLIVIVIILVFFTKYIRNQSLEQERVRQSEMALTKVLHYLPTGIILMDKNRRVRQVNRAAVKLFQLEDEDIVIGQMLNENLLFSRFRIKDKYQVSTHGVRYIVIDATNQERVFFNDKIPFFLQSEKYFMESYHELTTYLQPVDKNLQGFKAGFITNISHELRTPLNGIMGMVEMLEKSPDLPEPEREMTQLAKRSAETLMGLINDILDYSRLEGGKLEVESIPFNLKEEIDSLIKEFLPEAREKKIIVTTAFDEPLPVDFIGDPVRIRQVLSNLLNNAIKFTPFGTIQIATSKAKTVNGGPAIKFCIKDSGIGIKPGKLEKIFEPFSQADQSLTRKYGGTGLGTTISKHLVLLMGGEIFAKSPSGLSPDPQYPGAEICFALPLKTRKYTKKLDFTGIFSFAQLKCLVISDDPLQVQVICRNFIALGVDFKVLPPSRETLDMLKMRDSIHLVVIDHRYDLNGLDFLQEMHNHQLHKESLIILQSSDYQASNTTIAHRLGADVYLRKPIHLDTLREFLLNNFPDLMARERAAILSVPEELKIMVIEDNVLNQKVIRNLLRKIGYDISVVASVAEAFEVLNDFDLILIDFYILQTAGSQIVHEIKEKNSNCPVVVMASSFDLNDDTRNNLLQSGVDDFLLKPFDIQLVSDVLFRMVAP